MIVSSAPAHTVAMLLNSKWGEVIEFHNQDRPFRLAFPLSSYFNSERFTKIFYSLSATPIFDQAPLLKEKNLAVSDSAILHVYFQSTYYQSQNKEELIGFTEFLCELSLIKISSKCTLYYLRFIAYTGGLLSLFMGFSVFSIVEIFYFLSIRPYSSNLKNLERRRIKFRRLFQRFRNKIRGTGSTTSDNTTTVNNVLFPHIN